MVMVKPQPSRSKPRKRNPTPWLLGPALVLLIVCTQVPFAMTIYCSFRRLNLLSPDNQGWVGLDNCISLLTDPILWQAMLNTVVLIEWVMVFTILPIMVLGWIAQKQLVRGLTLGAVK